MVQALLLHYPIKTPLNENQLVISQKRMPITIIQQIFKFEKSPLSMVKDIYTQTRYHATPSISHKFETKPEKTTYHKKRQLCPLPNKCPHVGQPRRKISQGNNALVPSPNPLNAAESPRSYRLLVTRSSP
jgi:hypothetical protein